MACTCVVLSKCVFQQLIFCSCVTVTLNYALVLKMANRFLELSGMALVTSGVLTLVKTGITFTVVSYFGEVCFSLRSDSSLEIYTSAVQNNSGEVYTRLGFLEQKLCLFFFSLLHVVAPL